MREFGWSNTLCMIRTVTSVIWSSPQAPRNSLATLTQLSPAAPPLQALATRCGEQHAASQGTCAAVPLKHADTNTPHMHTPKPCNRRASAPPPRAAASGHEPPWKRRSPTMSRNPLLVHTIQERRLYPKMEKGRSGTAAAVRTNVHASTGIETKCADTQCKGQKLPPTLHNVACTHQMHAPAARSAAAANVQLPRTPRHEPPLLQRPLRGLPVCYAGLLQLLCSCHPCAHGSTLSPRCPPA